MTLHAQCAWHECLPQPCLCLAAATIITVTACQRPQVCHCEHILQPAIRHLSTIPNPACTDSAIDSRLLAALAPWIARMVTCRRIKFSACLSATYAASNPDGTHGAAALLRLARWRSVLRQPDDGYTTDAAHFEGNVKQLSTWLALHLAWLDQQFSDVMAGKDNGAGMGTAAAGPAAAGPAGAAPVGPLAAVFGKLVGMMG